MFGFSVGVAIFTAFSTFLEQFLCPWGYSDTFAGLVGALMIAGGVLAAGIICSIVDRTGAFNEAMKLCFAGSTLSSIVFFIIMTRRHFEAPILISVVLYGAFAISCYPLSLELGAEITYPALETVSTGLLLQGSQILSVLLIVVVQATATNLKDAPASVCQAGGVPQSFQIPAYILSGLGTFACFPVILIFKGQYRRRRAEHSTANVVNGSTEVIS